MFHDNCKICRYYLHRDQATLLHGKKFVHEGRNGREKVNKKQEPRKEKVSSVTKESDEMDDFTCPCSRWIVDWFTLFVA